MALSTTSRRGGLAAPVLLLLCFGSAAATGSPSVQAAAAATPGATARGTASTSGSGEPLTVTAVAPPPLAVPPRSACGTAGVRCCGAGDEQEDPCSFGGFCSSGTCVTCGFPGEMCCPGSTCTDFTTTCNADNVCAVTCGVPGLPCCIDGEEDFAPDGCSGFDSLCVSDVCIACGGVGEPCCRDDECELIGSECNTAKGVCSEQTCGIPGLPCCDDADYAQECDFSAECVGGSCVECGVNGAACCTAVAPDYPGYCYETNGECTEEGICAGGKPKAPPPLPAPIVPNDCGFAGRKCCGAEDEAPPCDSSAFCSSGVCASCGFPGSSCCANGECSRGSCNDDNICIITCGVTGLPCCTKDTIDEGPRPVLDTPVAAETQDVDTSYAPELEPFFYECGGFPYDSICSAEDVCAPCGQVGEQCCENESCSAFRAQCDTKENVCTAPTCGQKGQPCCNPAEEDGFVCDTRLGCFDGQCETCGFDGTQCCPEADSVYDSQCYGDIAECSADNTCTDALTADGDCGFYGDSCCEGGNCAQGTVCEGGSCTSCGFESGPCCRGGTCEFAAECTDNVCGPPVCGQFDGSCCTPDVSDSPCGSGFCLDGKCASCGFSGEPCCPTGMPCFGNNAECSAGNVCEGDYDYAPYPTPEPAVPGAASPSPLPPPATAKPPKASA